MNVVPWGMYWPQMVVSLTATRMVTETGGNSRRTSWHTAFRKGSFPIVSEVTMASGSSSGWGTRL